jgi:site-specific DNA recombinase
VKVALYARFSTKHQNEHSIADQFAEARRWAERQGHSVVAEFSDAGISGTKSRKKRPGLAAMLDAIEASKGRAFAAVVVTDQDRLSRSFMGGLNLIYGDLANHGVRLLDLTGFDSGSDMSEMMAAMKSAVAAQYIKSIMKKSRVGLDARARGGFHTGGTVYGYKTSPEENPIDPAKPRKLVEIDETQAPIVRRIYAMAERGCGYREIVHALNRDGIAPPRGGADGWGHAMVRKILHNPRYAGTWTWGSTKVVHKRDSVEKEETPDAAIVREMPHLAIIEPARWRRVQKMLGARNRRGAKPYANVPPVLVSGILRCSSCGGAFTSQGVKRSPDGSKRWISLGCGRHSMHGETACGNGACISEKKASGAILTALRELLAKPAAVDAFVRGFKDRFAERTAAPGADNAKQLAAAQKRVSNCTRLLAEDPDDAEARRLREEAKAEVRRLESEQSTAAAPRELPSPQAIRAALVAFVQLAESKPEVAHGELVRAGASFVVVPRPDGRHRFRLRGSLNVGALVSADGHSGSAKYQLDEHTRDRPEASQQLEIHGPAKVIFYDADSRPAEVARPDVFGVEFALPKPHGNDEP